MWKGIHNMNSNWIFFFFSNWKWKRRMELSKFSISFCDSLTRACMLKIYIVLHCLPWSDIRLSKLLLEASLTAFSYLTAKSEAISSILPNQNAFGWFWSCDISFNLRKISSIKQIVSVHITTLLFCFHGGVATAVIIIDWMHLVWIKTSQWYDGNYIQVI